MTPALRHKTDPGIVFIDNDSAARLDPQAASSLAGRTPAA